MNRICWQQVFTSRYYSSSCSAYVANILFWMEVLNLKTPVSGYMELILVLAWFFYPLVIKPIEIINLPKSLTDALPIYRHILLWFYRVGVMGKIKKTPMQNCIGLVHILLSILWQLKSI